MWRRIHGDSLRQAVGLFCLLLGALILVAPAPVLRTRLSQPSARILPALGVGTICGGLLLDRYHRSGRCAADVRRRPRRGSDSADQPLA